MNRLFKWSTMIIPVLLIFGSCTAKQENLLHGKWQASQISEEGAPLEVELSEIRFQFHPDGSYQFYSTLGYREAGSYKLERNILYTLDTVNEQSVEKTVQLLYLSADTLRINMNREGKARMLELFKSQ